MSADDDLTHSIINAAMEVHRVLGSGFQEVVYQRALAIELSDREISHERELSMDLFYKGHAVGERWVDFLVEDRIMVELKAITELEPVHLAQGLNYLTAYNLDTGLLINFGGRSLEFKRLYRKS